MKTRAVNTPAFASSVASPLEAISQMVPGTNLWLATGITALLLCLDGTAVAKASPHQTAGFELAGIITQAGNGKTSLWCRFSVAVSGERSLISTRYFNGESLVCGTDGRDSYFLNEMRTGRLKNPSNPEFGTITTGPFPKKALSPAQLVWLAYASSALGSEQNPKLPIGTLHEFRGFATNEVTWSQQAPRLPVHVKWWAPDFKFNAQNRTNYLIDYPDGYLAGEFTAASPTNFLGNTLPRSWSYTSFIPKSFAVAAVSGQFAAELRKQVGTTPLSRDDVVAGQTLICTVTNLSRLTYEGDFLPTLASNVVIADWRFKRELGHSLVLPIKIFRKRKDGTLVDASPKTRWLKRSDPELIQLLKSQRSR